MKTYQDLRETLQAQGRKISAADFFEGMEIAESNWDEIYGSEARKENPEQFLDWCLENWKLQVPFRRQKNAHGRHVLPR